MSYKDYKLLDHRNITTRIYHTTVRLHWRNSTEKHTRELTRVEPDAASYADLLWVRHTLLSRERSCMGRNTWRAQRTSAQEARPEKAVRPCTRHVIRSPGLLMVQYSLKPRNFLIKLNKSTYIPLSIILIDWVRTGRRENILLSVMAYGPRAKYFPMRPSLSGNKYMVSSGFKVLFCIHWWNRGILAFLKSDILIESQKEVCSNGNMN